ncbi:hypothetical protein CR513_11975, partial [Mucuna pruriens]
MATMRRGKPDLRKKFLIPDTSQSCYPGLITVIESKVELKLCKTGIHRWALLMEFPKYGNYTLLTGQSVMPYSMLRASPMGNPSMAMVRLFSSVPCLSKGESEPCPKALQLGKRRCYCKPQEGEMKGAAITGPIGSSVLICGLQLQKTIHWYIMKIN